MMHTEFGPNYIGVGEDHKGKYAFDFKNKKQTQHLYDMFLKSKVITCWFEGPNASKKSPSFVAFVKDLKKWQNTYKELSSVKVQEKGWELSLKFNREEEITGILLGAEAYEYEKLIGNQLDRRQTLAQAFVNSKAIKGSQSTPVTMPELIKCLSDQNGPTDVLNQMTQPESANRKTLDIIYGGGYSAMRAKYFEGSPNSKTSSSVYKRVQGFNEARDKHLANLMRTKGGIFLAGDQHIEFIGKFL